MNCLNNQVLIYIMFRIHINDLSFTDFTLFADDTIMTITVDALRASIGKSVIAQGGTAAKL